MKISIKNFQIFSAIFVMILGNLLHFTYEWSEGNLLVASFSAVNESTWEHLKLLFYPMLLTTIIGYFYFGKNKHNFLCANAIGILTAISFTTVFFYTYTGIIGTNFAFLDIGSFFVAVILGEWKVPTYPKKPPFPSTLVVFAKSVFSIGLMLLMSVIFIEPNTCFTIIVSFSI